MGEISERLEDALGRVEPAWDEARTEAAWRGVGRKRRRRAAVRAAGAAAAVVLIAGAALHLYDTRGETDRVATAPDPKVELAPEDSRDIVIHHGLAVTPEDDATIDVERRQAEPVRVRVIHGKSRFAVSDPAAEPSRARVTAGDLEVTVYASEFSVARYRDVAEVWSHRGRMEVLWRGETVVLEPGEHRRFDAAAPELLPADEGDIEIDGERKAEPQPERDRSRKAGPDWRVLAREGQYERAFAALTRAAAPRGAADLMLAADVYRLSGHPKRAAKVLERMVDDHADDPRAPLAAFTLGRILLDDLGRPTTAARAFAKTVRFAPEGPMAEDALAREVEAWAKAGQAQRARDRAQRYLERYPRGHRARAVRNYGGL